MASLDERLILCIEEHPTLWDTRQPAYKDSTAKQGAWRRIARELNITGVLSVFKHLLYFQTTTSLDPYTPQNWPKFTLPSCQLTM